MFPSPAAPSPAELRAWTARLGTEDAGGSDRLERVRALEELRGAVAAAQAVEVAALAVERAAEVEQEIATVPQPGVGVRRRREHARRQMIAEVALARRISPWQAQRFVAWAGTAPSATPRTFALLSRGELSERRAMTVHRITEPLAVEDRRRIDTDLTPHLPGWGDRKIDQQTRAAVYRVDPHGTCERAAHAANERCVSTRPAPETMGWLTALLPMPQLVACRAALEQAAVTALAAGDPRGRGQIMADTLVERVTGQTSADAVPLSIQLVVTDRTLLGVADTPARLADGSPLPAPLARALVLDTDTAKRVRRLFTDRAGRLVTAETHSRDFTKAMAECISLRDEGLCTTDCCDAPVRHTDHVDPHVHGGPTSITNDRGTCVWCNQTKADRPPPEPVPTPPPRHVPPRPRRRQRSRVERHARRAITNAARRPQIEVHLPEYRCTLQQ